MVHANCTRWLILFLALGASVALSAATDGAAEKIKVEGFDAPRMARAIFEATNRMRTQLGLPAFRGLAKLDDAAETQARIGALFRPPSHTNPFPLIATPRDRVKLTGLKPRFVAENIAMLAIYDVPSGAGFYRLKGETEVRDDKTGQPLRVHTYESFATAVVEAWMNSPGHRASIVDKRLEYLGCCALPAQSQSGIDMIFAVQVFYTPEGRERNAGR